MKKNRRIALPGTRWCPRCQQFQPKDQFTGGYCKSCYREYHTEWARDTKSTAVGKLMQEALEAYGPQCKMCGQADVRVLIVYPRGRSGLRTHLHSLRAQGWPSNHGILCLNCAKVESDK